MTNVKRKILINNNNNKIEKIRLHVTRTLKNEITCSHWQQFMQLSKTDTVYETQIFKTKKVEVIRDFIQVKFLEKNVQIVFSLPEGSTIYHLNV